MRKPAFQQDLAIVNRQDSFEYYVSPRLPSSTRGRNVTSLVTRYNIVSAGGHDMGVYDNLDKFSLELHGDGREQQWAKHVLPEFPAYEEFWRKYIVPLTNRVDPQVSRSQNPQSWIGIRTEVRPVHEQMGMHHYSILYYLARATQRIRSGNSE